MKAKKKYKLYDWQNKAQKQNNGEDQGLKCELCGDKRMITVDHIVPHTFLKAFDTDIDWGLDYEENFQYLCKYHNQLKQSRLDAKDLRTYSIIRKVLEVSEKYHLT